MENIVHSVPVARSTGKYFSFYQPLERAYAMVATKDVGRVAAEALLDNWTGDRVIEIAGPQAYSSNDVADALASALGQPVAAVAVPREQWVEVLAQNGMPAERSGAYIELVENLNSGWIHLGVPGAAYVTGTTDLVTTVRELAASLGR